MLIRRLMRSGCLWVHTATPVLPPPGTTAPSCPDINTHTWHSVCKSCWKHPSSMKDHEGPAPGSTALAQSVQSFSQFSRSVVSDSFRPHGLQHARLPSLSPAPGVYSNSCPLSQWCHPTISSSVIPFSSRLQSFPASGSFQMSQVAKVLEFQLQHLSFQWIFRTDSFRMDWLDLLAVQGTLKSLIQHYSIKQSVLWHSAFFIVQLSHPYMTTGKTIALTRRSSGRESRANSSA